MIIVIVIIVYENDSVYLGIFFLYVIVLVNLVFIFYCI